MRYASQHPAGQARPGFTVVELLTAVFVTMIMMLMISRIFRDTTNAVGDGIHTSRALANARAIGDELRVNFRSMLPPSTNAAKDRGCLIIISRIRQNTKFIYPTGGEGTRTVRDDQIIFFTKANASNPLRSTTPGYTTSYFNPSTANVARVWLGHVQPIKSKFTPGSPPSAMDSTAALGTAPNDIATNWVLGRQALLLTGQQALTQSGVAVYANGVTWNATVNTAGGSLYESKTDVCNKTLREVIGTAAEPGPPLLQDSFNNGVYKAAAESMAFLTEMPRVRAVVDSLDSTNTYRGFKAADVAQSHTFVSGNCSDFIVEFAGDYDGNGVLDTATGSPEQVQLKWYSAFVGAAATAGPNCDAVNGSYILPASATGGATPIFQADSAQSHIVHSINGTTTAFIFRHGIPSNWPRFIRVRYRLHDDLGRLMDQGNESGKWFEQVYEVPAGT